MVGGVEAGPAEATAAVARATAVAATSRTFTCPSYVCANDLRRMYRLVLLRSRPNPRAPDHLRLCIHLRARVGYFRTRSFEKSMLNHFFCHFAIEPFAVSVLIARSTAGFSF